MAIIRQKRQVNYSIINNQVFEREQLSYEAMGMLCYLLSKPDNWEVSPSELANVTAKTRKHSRSNSVYTILSELISAGYLQRVKKASGHTDYLVFDEPNQEKPVQENPDKGKPNQENPVQENTTQVSTDIKTSTDLKVSNQSCADAPVSAKAKTEKAPTKEIFDLYNEILGDQLPKAQVLSDKRKKAIAARWNEFFNTKNPQSGKTRYADKDSGLEWWAAFFRKVKLNSHWVGDNDRGWSADLDWITKYANFVKILEWRPAQKGGN